MKTRGYVRITSFMLLGLSILFAMSIINTKNMNYYKRELEVSYQHSLSELSECMSTINTDLNKSLYSNSANEQQQLSRELFAQCSVAKNAVSRLPVSQMELGGTYKFLSQASDYAQYIQKKLESGQSLTEQEHKNIKTLLGYSERFSRSVSDMMRLSYSGAKITEGNVKNAENISVTPLSNSFSESAKGFESFPTLLYDGPFSDRVLNKKSKLVSNAEIRSKEECRSIAAKCLGVTENKIIFDSDERSLIPCYTFRNGRYTVSVTKQGGYIKSILYSGVIRSKDISEENAVNLAKRFLDRIGYKNMKESYYSKQDNVCTVNFCYAKGGVYQYSDLIKVGVSLSDGKIISLDSSTYLTNHVKRAKFSEKTTAKEAANKVSPYLKIKGVKKAVIPKDNGKEVQCWEFTCTSTDTGEDTLIYINNKTGEEEDILLLLYTDGGTLTE